MSQSREEHMQADEGLGRFSYIDVALAVAKRKKFVVGLPLVSGLLAAAVSLLIPNTYVGRAVLMPPQQQSSATAMLGQIGALAAYAGGPMGLKNPSELYIGMLKSRTIADSLIDEFGLKAVYNQPTLVETRSALADVTSIKTGKDGLISIEAEDQDPERAAALANAYAKALDELTGRLAITEAAQRRLFFEKQMAKVKDDLAQAERKFTETQEKTGIVQLDQQGRATIEALATLRAQIVAREVEIAAIRSYATESNPDYIRAQQEVSGLRAELRRLERGGGTGEEYLISTKKIPAAGLAYARGYRDVKYYETIFELLAKQYELARIDEAKDAAVVQVVDHAVVSDRKAGPHRALIVMFTIIIAGIVAVVIAFFMESVSYASKNPITSGNIDELKRLLGLNKG